MITLPCAIAGVKATADWQNSGHLNDLALLNIPDSTSAAADTTTYIKESKEAAAEAHAPVQKKSEGTSFTNNLLYFAGAAIVATLVYIVWPEKESTTKLNSTFGTPLPPK